MVPQIDLNMKLVIIYAPVLLKPNCGILSGMLSKLRPFAGLQYHLLHCPDRVRDIPPSVVVLTGQQDQKAQQKRLVGEVERLQVFAVCMH